MRRGVLLLLLLATLSGCLGRDACCNAWRIEGDDPALYAALARAEGVRAFEPQGIEVRHARLDEAWRDYSLVQVFHLVAAEGPTTIQLHPTPEGDLEVAAAAPADAEPAALRDAYGRFLARALDAGEDERRALVEALLANRTAAGERTVEPATDPPTYEVSYVRYAARTPLPHRLAAAFAEAVADASWAPFEPYAGATGQVEAHGLVFGFAFPTRSLDVADDERELHVLATSHGSMRGHLRLARAVGPDDARDEVVAALARAGASALDARAWRFEGSDGGAWRPPPGAEPAPTPR
ncbi:MAG TPA: hypothetical protein VM582_01255 [Candidatus Thermoplasmatota archaeon]|nr:hypothetical protein [Candidatus Thermoplasmatota archaeon]